MPLQYPFSAVLGCESDGTTPMGPMGLALVLNAISPEIGGVLVRGEKGTAKSTTVRALAEVLPAITVHPGDRFSVEPGVETSPDGTFTETSTRPVRLVELPVGATEDRVLGSIHLEKALTSGAVEFEPGLLARAHRGVLYVDEVNLLHDHLVDLLLDAAATGRVTVERDGVSLGHAARFVLIGTMNPEEGELRPQLLDRFGLTAEVAAPRDPALRVEVVRRRMAHDADPEAFVAAHAEQQAALTRRIDAARAALASTVLGDGAMLKIAEVCAAFDVDGLRADLVTARTALAHAAWSGRRHVTRADIRAAALLALPHRRRRNPFDAPGLDEELLDQLLGDDEPDPPHDPQDPEGSDGPERPDSPDDADGPDTPGEADASGTDHPGTDEQPGGAGPAQSGPSDLTDHAGQPRDTDPAAEQAEQAGTSEVPERPQPPAAPGGPGSEQQHRASTPYRPKLLTVDGLGAGAPGRRSRALGPSGRRVGAGTGTGSLHLVETLRAAAERHAAASAGGAGGGRVAIAPADLRTAVREGREANLLLFCVDASGSMAARRRMVEVKTAILSLLTDAYRRRDKVGLVTFRRDGADLVLPPTSSVDVAAALLDDLPAGGRTPLAEGLLLAGDVLRRERTRDARLRPLLVLVTDGRATAGTDPVTRSHRAAAHIARLGVPAVVVDPEDGPLRLGLARTLAGHLAAEHVAVGQLSASGLTAAVTHPGLVA